MWRERVWQLLFNICASGVGTTRWALFLFFFGERRGRGARGEILRRRQLLIRSVVSMHVNCEVQSRPKMTGVESSFMQMMFSFAHVFTVVNRCTTLYVMCSMCEMSRRLGTEKRRRDLTGDV